MKRLFLSYPWIISTAIFSLLVIWAATLHPLWVDEAETALFAKSIIRQCCLPRGWDGVNLMGMMNAVYLNSDLINSSNPPLQYYMTALSFTIFGQSDRTARLPFILFSVASVVTLYYLTLDLTKQKRIALLSTVVVSLSVPFILFAYQVRYYPLTIFFSLLFLLCTARLVQKSVLPAIGFVVSGVGYAYSHYVSFATFFIAAGIVFSIDIFLSNRRRFGTFVMRYLLLGGVAIALFLPWFVYFRPYEGRAALALPDAVEAGKHIALSMVEIFHYFNHNNAFPFLFLPLLLLTVLFPFKYGSNRPLLLVSSLILVYIFLTASLYVFVYFESPLIAVRHNMLLFPLFVIVSSVILERIFRFQKLLFWCLLTVYITTNMFTLQGFPPRSFLLEFANELRHPYTVANELVVDYLNRHAQDGETIFVNLEQDNETLIYYLNKKLRFVNRVHPNNPKLFPKNYAVLPQYVYKFQGKPDWIILYSKRGFDGTPFTIYNRPMPAGVDLTNDYTETILPVFFWDLSQPEIEIHAFGEVVPQWRDQVFVYQRIKK